jgi:hypothetical protein
MRVQGVGELTDNDTYWHLAYDDCSHVQAFAREGLDDPEGATFFVRRHYAQCLACALVNKAVATETPSVKPAQFHLVLSLDELAAIVTVLRSSADRLENVLRQLGRAP